MVESPESRKSDRAREAYDSTQGGSAGSRDALLAGRAARPTLRPRTLDAAALMDAEPAGATPRPEHADADGTRGGPRGAPPREP